MVDILTDSKYLNILEIHASKYGEDLDQVTKEAESYLKELYTEQNPLVHSMAVQASQYILSRGYDRTIDTNTEEVKELSKIMRRHPVAFVMTHKTYIDMFVLAIALARHGLPIPHIFAGINMSFFGLGDMGRKSGAIFIRRSFKDNPLYKAVLRFFILHLVDQNKHFMWAIEGTRSRTGKLVWPKMGILKYIAEADAQSRNEVKYIPVSIVYDLIPDVDQMVREGRGSEKSKESFAWFMKYVKNMGEDFGKISIRFSDPVDMLAESKVDTSVHAMGDRPKLPKFAFNLVHEINNVTPVTTGSLIFTSLLSQFALTKIQLETSVVELMELVENHKADALVERGKPLNQSIQTALNRFIKSGMVRKIGQGHTTKYSIVPEKYLAATYYANMSVHYLFHRAFIELALVKLKMSRSKYRLRLFWEEIMTLRDMFKFEFFYSNKLDFTDEIEKDLGYFHEDWSNILKDEKANPLSLLEGKHMLLSQTALSTYIEAYKVVGECLSRRESGVLYNEAELLNECLFLGEEMHWMGKIHRVDSVSKPFILNGIRLAVNKGLISSNGSIDKKGVKQWVAYLEDLTKRISVLQSFIKKFKEKNEHLAHIERNIIPGSKTESVTSPILEGEKGAHIGAFFDLDRTLIKGFSAKEFFQSRLYSGKMSGKEIVAQFSGVMVYALGNRNFAGLAAISAQGINGLDEKTFIEVGEEVYLKHLASEIYPESRALVEAHIAMGHTVAIISAATPYQVNPVARDLGIEHIMCTQMEVIKGKFTGKIVEPACWGEGKAYAANQLAETHLLDMSKSHFYTDSAEDLPLLEIVGYPHSINPDAELSKISFDNDWPITRFNDDKRPGVSNLVRTGLAISSLIPATIAGVLSGTISMSHKDGINSMMSAIGDFGCMVAGIKMVVKGDEHIWKNRPAVFIFNHQSNVDLLIMAKLLRRDAVAIAKNELKLSPVGPLFMAAGVIFIDRGDKDKAIEAMAPAVEALKNGTSVGLAPEGTRSKDYRLGSFKKGAFHLAMQAGVPIVPIVIKNAHDVMPKGSNFIKPSVVEVVVQPAVKTNRWKVEDLDKHIAKIRKGYLKELGQE
ncbi:MAG: putative phosphoserine phosphatase/1-acylglycerol-3-phosphate O-acyltransferase [Saprospiraceae bacterium]|jgi:putative phosphoserine phosphatase/1-acylglycerol-3-phosphate O-acyltransferase